MTTPPQRSDTIHGPGSSDDFALRLQHGGDLLAAGKLAEARIELEAAIVLQPKNQKAQSLLGLTCFKLGALERAGSMYELLVRENPVEPTLRVNLGLVYLKQGGLTLAIKEFETAVDLAPDHKKAQNYFGLALAQVGDYARARDAFLAAGSPSMAERMEQALAAQRATEAVHDHTEAQAAPPRSFTELEGESPVKAPPLAPPLQIEAAAPPLPGPGSPLKLPDPARPPTHQTLDLPHPLTAQPARAQAPGMSQSMDEPPPWRAGAIDERRPQPLPELARQIEVTSARPTTGPFHLQGDILALHVEGELLCRIEPLLAITGHVELQPEMKRFRGRATDKSFGKGPRRLMRLTGSGIVWVGAPGHRLRVVELEDGAAYFAEDALFGFEEPLTFENGRLPGKAAADLNLVHLRGRGQVLLSVDGPLRSLPVSPDSPLFVHQEMLIAWLGNLTPRIIHATPDVDGETPLAVVELTGEGFALFCVPEPE